MGRDDSNSGDFNELAKTVKLLALRSVGIFIIGLIIRVHPDHIVASSISWISFIMACLMLYRSESNIAKTIKYPDLIAAFRLESHPWSYSIIKIPTDPYAWAVMLSSLAYNAWFHYQLIWGWI